VSVQDSPLPAAAGERRWHLEDERDFLVRSLGDLAAELEAGDIGQADYDALSSRDERRLAVVEAALEALPAEHGPGSGPEDPPTAPAAPEPGARRGRSRRRWLAAVAVVALSAGTTLLVVRLTQPSLPGQPVTGSTPQTVAAQLAEAAALVDEGTSTSLSEALSLYRTVLSEDPNQPQALAETGYLEWEAGFSAADVAQERQGRSLVERSLRVARDDYAAHLFLGTMDLEQDHDPAAAVRQFQLFVSEHPPKAELATAASIVRQAYSEAGRPLPAGIPPA